MRLLKFAAGIALVLLAAAPAAAEDFRVETDVFVGDEKQPLAQFLTLFKGGAVYDFMLDEPGEITIYDVQRGRFVLLAPSRQVQTSIDAQSLLQFCAGIQAKAAMMNDPLASFLAHPEFQVKFHANESRIVLASPRLTYQAQGFAPESESAARRYQRFADGYARLNAVRSGGFPPFARMQLNAELLERGWVPKEVVKTIAPRAGFREGRRIRSRHAFTWKVLPSDEERIESADAYLAAFESVSLPEYLKEPRRVAKGEQ